MNKTNEKKQDATNTKKDVPCADNKSKTTANPSAKK